MTSPAVFTYEAQQLRTVDIDGQPWFVVADVCRILGLSNPTMAAQTLDSGDLSTAEVTDALGRKQVVNAVSEPGLYELIFQSRKPDAKAFRRWVTHDVIPTIRRTGSYAADPVALPSMKQLAQMVIESETARELAEARVAELEPAAEVATRLLDADGDLSVGDAAKALTRAGVVVGAGRLFNLLDQHAWIYRDRGDGRWRVYQTAIERGYMSVLPQSHYHPKSGVLVLDPPQPRVTPKGLQRLLADHGAVTA